LHRVAGGSTQAGWNHLNKFLSVTGAKRLFLLEGFETVKSGREGAGGRPREEKEGQGFTFPS